MRVYVIITLVVFFLFSTEAVGRKKIISSKKLTEAKTTDITPTVKVSDKPNYPKKATSLKKRPTKTPATVTANLTAASPTKSKSSKDVTEAFKNLPEDDLKFIKELDKQFKLHGGKLKIKVERENTTDTSKNSKRTIEGDLGYGYSHNGYSYERPKFTFYPYSQKDIPANAPSYYPQYESTSVTVEPSYSYELKPQTYLITHGSSEPQIDLPHSNEAATASHAEIESHQPESYQEPVIVLRIPGPAKYASHLQALLQQYLEIRAAQYLRILQDTESRKQIHSQQYSQEVSGHNQQYEQPAPVQHVETPPSEYAADVSYSHHAVPTPQPITYPAIDDVYQAYKGRQHYQHQGEIDHQEQPAQHDSANHAYSHVPQTEAQQQYYYPETQQQIQDHVQPSYQQVYFISMTPKDYSNEAQHQPQHQHYGLPQQPIYVQEDEPNGANQAYEYNHEAQIPTSENNPRPTHTKIFFASHGDNSASEQAHSYPLPSIRPFERHAPTSVPSYQQQYHQHGATEQDYQQSVHAETSPHQETVSITQHPFNYHAHSSQHHPRGRKRATPKAPPATTKPVTTNLKTSDETEQRLQKIRAYVQDKLGAQMASSVEIKRTQIIEG